MVFKLKEPEPLPSTPETKAEKFVRLAEKRTTKIIKYLRSLSKLANTSAYQFTPDQIEQIFTSLGEEYVDAKLAFQSPRSDENYRFKLVNAATDTE